MRLFDNNGYMVALAVTETTMATKKKQRDLKQRVERKWIRNEANS